MTVTESDVVAELEDLFQMREIEEGSILDDVFRIEAEDSKIVLMLTDRTRITLTVSVSSEEP